MAMLQNSFANSSFSLLVGKMQGTIVDYLMPPLSVGELIAGLVGAAVTRAFLVGFAVWLVMSIWPGVHVGISHPLSVFWFGLMGALMLAFLGLMTSIWADKFDHAAAVTNFVVAPLSLLSGTFYSVEQLAPGLPGGQPCQPLLLRDLRASATASWAKPIRRSMSAAIGLLLLNIAAVRGLLRAPQERVENQELSRFKRLNR